MKRYPFWPAKIVSPPTVKERVYRVKEMQKKKSSTPRNPEHYVFFFGRETCAWISGENIVPHSEEMLNNVTKKKKVAYIKGVNQIIEESGSVVKLKPKLNTIQKPTRRSDDILTQISSIPFLHITYSRPIDVLSWCTSPNMKELYMRLKIGFISSGLMGQIIMKNLLNAGHNVCVWNRTPKKCKESVDARARQFSSLEDLLRNCHIVFSLLSGSEAVKYMVLGNGGILQTLEKCQENANCFCYVELTSIHPNTSFEIASAITGKDVDYLAAPITGSLSDAEEGSLKVHIEGLYQVFILCFLYFSIICKEVLFLGPEAKRAADLILDHMKRVLP
ncbi:putative oxidoreductase GLYR1 [Trichonephila inaurata madagascariensis]|uniref:Putative oxidoreductase GLYR1 n=1 Tax=Trichonephila inaurata madagascariensis TaxID=2747483 RepID=A0A8X6X3A4_9ARAC|nr:putative oxidoreductase GLYR1 [Trichonephila inaurata madagascariensis]GFY56772.1 putative oxidoreductase GLYR1 [Trichonephila inaurata madagascariensis]